MVRVGCGGSSVAVAVGGICAAGPAGAAAAVSGTATAVAAAAAISRRGILRARGRMVLPWVVAEGSTVGWVPERSVVRHPPRRTLGCTAESANLSHKGAFGGGTAAE